MPDYVKEFMMGQYVVGVMGPGVDATLLDINNGQKLGRLIAKEGWVLLSGGKNEGVMNAASKGANSENGLVIGILPDTDESEFSSFLDIKIITDIGSARNNINVLSSDVVIACGMSSGTASEVALAISANKKTILLNTGNSCEKFFKQMAPDLVFIAKGSEEAISIIKNFLENK